MNLQYLDPVLLGRYPAELRDIFGDAWPDWPAEDLALIAQPIDFVGINYYTRNVTCFDADRGLLRAAPVRQPQGAGVAGQDGWKEGPGRARTRAHVGVDEQVDVGLGSSVHPRCHRPALASVHREA